MRVGSIRFRDVRAVSLHVTRPIPNRDYGPRMRHLSLILVVAACGSSVTQVGDDDPASDAASGADAAEPDTQPGVFRLEDSLRNTTLGNTVGGSLGPDGWTVTGRADRVWYALPRLAQGSIEFT